MRHTQTISGWKFHRDERSEILIKMAPLPLLLLTFAAATSTWIEDLWMKGLFCKKERLKNKQKICQLPIRCNQLLLMRHFCIAPFLEIMLLLQPKYLLNIILKSRVEDVMHAQVHFTENSTVGYCYFFFFFSLLPQSVLRFICLCRHVCIQ